jgi:hypothetical protein
MLTIDHLHSVEDMAHRNDGPPERRLPLRSSVDRVVQPNHRTSVLRAPLPRGPLALPGAPLEQILREYTYRSLAEHGF